MGYLDLGLIYELIFFIQFAMKLLEWIFFEYFLPASINLIHFVLKIVLNFNNSS